MQGYKFIFENDKRYIVYENDLHIARAKLARALVQLKLGNYFLQRGDSAPPAGARHVVDNVYLLKHKVQRLKG